MIQASGGRQPSASCALGVSLRGPSLLTRQKVEGHTQWQHATVSPTQSPGFTRSVGSSVGFSFAFSAADFTLRPA